MGYMDISPIVLDPGTTNRYSDTQFASPSTSVNTFGCAVAQDPAMTREGNTALQITRQALGGEGFINQNVNPFVAGDPAVWHFWLRAAQPGVLATPRITARDSGGASLGPFDGLRVEVPTDGWIHAVAAADRLPALTSFIRVFVVFTAADGDVLWVVMPQVERRTTPTAFTTGTRATRYRRSVQRVGPDRVGVR